MRTVQSMAPPPPGAEAASPASPVEEAGLKIDVSDVPEGDMGMGSNAWYYPASVCVQG